jgi:enamine deaminase RidA (YjgF/YER057c/UK114 family)
MRHVCRVRAYLTDLSLAGGFIRAHGEVFAGIDPVLTGVEAGLTQPGMVVEIDVDAIIHDEDGRIHGI